MKPPKPPKSPVSPQCDRYHHGDLRQSLIDAAIELIQTSNVDQLSLREVARQVGVSHNAPYRHFPDKEALLSAVAEQGFQRLRLATENALVGTSSNSAERLRAIGSSYVQFAIQNPMYYRVMFSEYNRRQDEALKAAMAQSFAVLFMVIQEGQAIGYFRLGDPRLMAQTAWSLVHGIAMLTIDGQLPDFDGEEFDRFLQVSTQMLIEGFVIRC